MEKKTVFNFSDAPTYSKVLPIVGLLAGIGYAKYMKKDCIGCYLGFSLSFALVGSMPLLYQMKKAGDATISISIPTVQ
jgi:hypothetical protein